MSYDKRNALVKDHNLVITDENTKNSYSVTVNEEIGRGGSCIVYRGTQNDYVGQEAVNRTVIIKEFYPKTFDSQIRRLDNMDLKIPEEVQELFEDRLGLFCEGQAKHIVYANDNAGKALPPAAFSGKAHGTFYAVSYQGQGVVLSEADRSSKSLVDVLKISASICDAISAIHGNGMKLFLDCKPDNIYVFENRAYLFDFDTVQPLGRLRFCSYSDGWSAPEQVYHDDSGYADSKKIGFHTDIFSVGAVLFYLLIGRKPTKDDIESLQTGFDWRNSISLLQQEDALDDDVFLQELDRVMQSVLQPDADMRKADYGLRNAAIKAKHEFEHLADLAETAPDRHGFQKTSEEIRETNKRISDAREAMEHTIEKHSFKNFLFGSKKRILISISSFLAVALVFGITSFFGGRIVESIIPSNMVEIEQAMDTHILLKLSDANHQYEVGLENWRRLDYNRAERDILTARNDFSEEKSQSEIEVAKINNSLGCLYLDMGRYSDAYDYLNSAYVTFRDAYGDDDVGSLSVLFSIAQYDYYSGDIDTALKTLQQIQDRINLDENKAVAVSVRHFQALIYDELGDYSSAIETYQSVLDLYSEILDDGKLTGTLSNYANDPQLTQTEKDEYTEAIRWVIFTYYNLGKAYIHAADYDSAQRVLELALNMSLENIYIGTKDLTTSKLYMSLAQVYAIQGDTKKGIDYIDLAMRIQINLFDFEGVYPGLVDVYDIYGDILLQNDDVFEAETYYMNALNLAIDSFGENHPSTAKAHNSMGEYYLYCKNYDGAIAEFETAIEIRKNILGYQNVFTAQYLYNLAVAQEAYGKQDDAVDSISAAKDICKVLSVSSDFSALIDQLYEDLTR